MDIFEMYGEDSSPFEITSEETMEEDIMANGDTTRPLNLSDEDSDEDVPEELKGDFVDEQTGEHPQHQHHQKRKIDHSKVWPLLICYDDGDLSAHIFITQFYCILLKFLVGNQFRPLFR